MTLITHDEIRNAITTALQADATLNAAVKTWLKYLLNTGKIEYPAVYIDSIVQPLEGSGGTYEQHTSIAAPMIINMGVLSDIHQDAESVLGTLYKKVYEVLQADLTVGLNHFIIHDIPIITTKPAPKCGRAVTQAKMELHATWEEE